MIKIENNEKRWQAKTSYTKEYRTLLEKLLEINVRLTEVKGDERLRMKIDPLIDKLLYYFSLQVDKTLALHKRFDDQWDKGGGES